jgi:hypothetical protein
MKRSLLAIGVGILGLSLVPLNGALAESGKKGQKDKGVMNERSTGNEPFTGPGASGGSSGSVPGADEKSGKGKSSTTGMGAGDEVKKQSGSAGNKQSGGPGGGH